MLRVTSQGKLLIPIECQKVWVDTDLQLEQAELLTSDVEQVITGGTAEALSVIGMNVGGSVVGIV